MWTYSPKSQIYPVLHLKKCDKEVMGADSSPLLYPHEIPPGVFHHFLKPSAQQGTGPAGGSPDEGHEEIKGQKRLSYEDSLEELGLFSLERSPERPYSSLSVPLGGPTS